MCFYPTAQGKSLTVNNDNNKLKRKAVYIMFDAGSALNNADTMSRARRLDTRSCCNQTFKGPLTKQTFSASCLVTEQASKQSERSSMSFAKPPVSRGLTRTSVWSPNLLERAVVLQISRPPISHFQGNQGTIQSYLFRSFFFF